MSKPGRPLGLSLAIILSFVIFSLMPLVQAGFVLLLRHQFANIEFIDGGGAYGGSVDGISDTRLVLFTVTGLIFLVIAVLAWRGRPSIIRHVFIAAVFIITAASVGITVLSSNQDVTLEQGIDSAGQLTSTLSVFQIGVSILVSLYVIWYANRGPARAFFRGYYLSSPAESGD